MSGHFVAPEAKRDDAPEREQPAPAAERWFRGAQFELEVGAVDDPLEVEADQIADLVVRRLESSAPPDAGSGTGDDESPGGHPNHRIARVADPALVSGRSAGSSRIRRSVGGDVAGPVGGEVDADLGQRIRRAQGAATPIRDENPSGHSRHRIARAADPALVSGRSAGSSRIRRSVGGDVAGPVGGEVDADLGQRIRRVQGAGTPMPNDVRSTMESGFGADLSSVRFHTGGDVDALNDRVGAKAFTVGNDVFFKSGVPDVATSGGRRLIAHELAHTFQQGGVQRQAVRRLFGRTKAPIDVQAEVDTYLEKKSDELRAYLGQQFGEKGMGFRRSKEARGWRQGVKDEARSQARSDVDDALDNYDPDGDGNRELLDTEKAYYRISAKKRVYSKAKTSVNTAVTSAVDDVYDRVWGAGQAIDRYAMMASAQHLAANQGDNAGALAAAKKTIDTKFEEAKNKGRMAKRVAFGKQQDDGSSGDVTAAAGRMDQGMLESQAQQQVQTDKVGEKAVKKTIEADSVDAGMGVFGKLLDNVVGSAGDQVSLAIEFKVPLEGFYISFTLTGKAARGIDGAMTAGVPEFGDPRRLEVMGEFKFRVGTGIPDVIDVGGDINLFTRGGANDTALCMKALSYGAYRRLGAISSTMANWWAGAAKGTEDETGKALRAESWAAMIEEQVFKEQDSGKEGGGFVDVGGGVATSTEVGSMDGLVGGFGFGGGVSGFHRYDKDSLKKSLGPDFGTVVADKVAANRRRKNVKGTGGASYSFNGKVAFGVPGGTKVELAGSISGSINNPASFGIEITGTIGYAGDSTSVIEKWAAGYATAAADLLKGFPKAVKPIMTDRADFGVFGEAIAATTQAVNAGLENTVTKGLASAWEVSSGPASGAAGLVTSSSLQVALIGGSNGEKPIFRLEIRSGRKLEINTPMAGAAGVKITAEKTSRLFAVGLDNGKVDMEMMGVRARGKTNQRGKKNRI